MNYSLLLLSLLLDPSNQSGFSLRTAWACLFLQESNLWRATPQSPADRAHFKKAKGTPFFEIGCLTDALENPPGYSRTIFLTAVSPSTCTRSKYTPGAPSHRTGRVPPPRWVCRETTSPNSVNTSISIREPAASNST